MLGDARVNRVPAQKHRFTCVPTALRRRLFRRRGHIDIRFAVDSRRWAKERAGYVLPRELRMRSFNVTKTNDETTLVFFRPGLLLLALLIVVGRFAREYSGERFGVRPRVVATPFDADRTPPGDLTMFASANSGTWSCTSSPGAPGCDSNASGGSACSGLGVCMARSGQFSLIFIVVNHLRDRGTYRVVCGR